MKNFKQLSLLGALALSALPTISSDITRAALFATAVTGATVRLQAKTVNPDNKTDLSTTAFTNIANPVVAGLLTAGAIGTYAAAKSSNPKVQAAAMFVGAPAIAYSAVLWMGQCSHAKDCIAGSKK